MPGPAYHFKTEFKFGTSLVSIVEGDILDPPVSVQKAALVCSDDNYLTMHSGVSFALRSRLGSRYVREVQAKCPVEAGTVIYTRLPARVNPKDDITHKLPPGIKYIFHSAIIDYDREDRDIEDILTPVVANCLSRAEELGLKSILLPALGAGAGGVEQMRKCARAICAAIKAYLAQERPVKQVVIVLHRPSSPLTAEDPQREARLQAFKHMANLVLDTPYNPLQSGRQSRYLYKRTDLIERLQRILNGGQPGKKHALLLGGPKSGKWSMLDQLYLIWQEDPASVKECFMTKVTFSNFTGNTSLSFIYRKLLIALARYEKDEHKRQAILNKYASPLISCSDFVGFLDQHYQEVVFLVDELPDLPPVQTGETLQPDDARAFWQDLDQLQARVHFLFTIRGEEQVSEFTHNLQQYAPAFQSQIEVIWVPCISEEQRRAWVKEIYQRWIEPGEKTNYQVDEFFQEEAGQHAYLISLAGFFLVDAVQQERVANPQQMFDPHNRLLMNQVVEKARQSLEGPRRKFFSAMLEVGRTEKINLLNLAKAIAREQEAQLLIPGVVAGNQRASDRLEQLQSEVNQRELLNPATMERLEQLGCVVRGQDERWGFMCRPFAAFVLENLGGATNLEDIPTDVVISLLPGKDSSIRTMFHSRGARILNADKLLSGDLVDAFLTEYRRFANPKSRAEGGENQEPVYKSAAELGNLLLTQFTTTAIKQYLQSPPKTCTVHFLVDESLQVIPWELMLEAAYAGEIPFRVGRSIASLRQPQNIRPPIRGVTHIKPLLIGNPTGDLIDAEDEIRILDQMFNHDPHFSSPDVLVGKKECRRMSILKALSSGRYGLVHFAGHSIAKGQDSAWLAADGPMTTQMLTSAVLMAPPAFIFSSSCSSASAASYESPSYEDQSFDLPGAFLLAGVQSYIGSLWDVDSQASSCFVDKFYTDFIRGLYNTGECLRRAKWTLKQTQPPDQNDWLAFILYGDPHIFPGEIFPVLRLTQ